MGAYAAAAGLLMSAGGAFLKGRAGDIVRNRLNDIAKTPGVDTNKITAEALNAQGANFDAASQLAGRTSAANQANLSAQEESALPGIGEARQGALSRINGLFADDAEWLKGVQRRGAALGLSSGLMGSQAGQLQTLRLSDQEQMQRTQLGTGLLGSLVGGLRIANTPGVQAFYGPNASDLVNIRSSERTQRMALEAKAAGVPGQTAAWGDWLTRQGGALEGAGITSMLGNGGTPSGGMPSASQQSLMMQDYYRGNSGYSMSGISNPQYNDFGNELNR